MVKSTNKERWATIKGYENYEISSYGRTRNTTSNKIIKPYCNGKAGYYKVKLYKNGVYTRFYVHRLVANAFMENPYKLPDINHKDENKFNNKLSNLEWCSRKYNLNYGSVRQRISEGLREYWRRKRLQNC